MIIRKNYFVIIILLCSAETIAPSQTKINSCSVPGINSEIFFPFGQKSDDLKIQCIQEGFSNFEIISLKLPIDREDIDRVELPSVQLSTFLGNSMKIFTEVVVPELKNKEIKNFTIIPNILFFKKINGFIGIELCFSDPEQKVLNIKRIALFFMQNITEDNLDKTNSILGFNRLAIYNSGELNKKMIIFGETNNNKEEIGKLMSTLFENLASKYKQNRIISTMLNITKSTVTSLTAGTIGLIIEPADREVEALAEFNKQSNITSTLLSGQEYLLYDPTNKKTLTLINAIKKNKMPLVPNYYLYGSVMGYDEKDIKLKYQLEEYLKSINNINLDGTVTWPYNIPKWIAKNKKGLDEWVNKKWNAHYYFFYPKEIRQYEYDKKEAQKYLKYIPITKEQAIKELKTIAPKISKIQTMKQYIQHLSKIKKIPIGLQVFSKKQALPKIIDEQTLTGRYAVKPNPILKAPKPPISLKELMTPENWESYSDTKKDLYIIRQLSTAYLDDLINGKIDDLSLLALEFDAKLFTNQMKDLVEKYIINPINNTINFFKSQSFTAPNSKNIDDYINKFVDAITDDLSYKTLEREAIITKLKKSDNKETFNTLLGQHAKSRDVKSKKALFDFLIDILIKFGYKQIKETATQKTII